MKKIILCYATIRPQVCLENIRHWIDTSGMVDGNLDFRIAINTQEEADFFKTNGFTDEQLIITDSPNIGYCYSMNCLTKSLEFNDDDILIFLADDIYSPQNWMRYIYAKFLYFDGCLHLDDGYQSAIPDNSGILPSLNIPAMTFSCLKKINKKLFNESYVHFFADNELYINMQDMGLLKDDRKMDRVIFEHRHYGINGKREKDKYDEAYCINVGADRQLFETRRLMNVQDRVK